jgi:hypothetical protein
MKKTLWLLAIILPVVLCAFRPAQATAIINIQYFLPESQIFYISDLDLLREGGGPNLFTVQIASSVTYANPKVRVSLLNGLRQTIASGTLNLTSRYLQTPGVPNVWVVNSHNVSGSDGNWETASDLTNQYQQQVLRTGMIPIDTYYWHFALLDDNGQEVPNTTDRAFTIRGMGFLNLRFPANDPRGDNPVMSTLPFFVWNSSQSSYSIKVAEIRQGETAEAALNSHENCEVSGITSTSFQYPSAGVIPLEPGKYYAWQVKTIMSTSHGPVEIASEINTFRIAPVMTPESSQLLAALQQLLTDGNGPQILQMIQRGNLTGEIYLGDQRITIQQLFSMLPGFSSQHYTIHSLRVE